MSNTLMLMMGGVGSRFGNVLPKQFTVVEGKPIFKYILEHYAHSDYIQNIVIVANKSWLGKVSEDLEDFTTSKRFSIVEGGTTRSESVKNGIASMKPYSSDDDNVLIHDATHPYVDDDAILNALHLMTEVDGVTLCQRQYDTCYIIDSEDNIKSVQPKAEIISGASPEIFHYGDLYKIYMNATPEELESMTSAGAIALKYNLVMKAVPSVLLNLKITYPEDMDLFRALCRTYYFGGVE